MKRMWIGIVVLVVTGLFLCFLWGTHKEISDGSPVSYMYDHENFAVEFVANGGYTFADIDSEYGKLVLPNIADEKIGVQAVSVNLDTLPLHDGDFIYLHLRGSEDGNDVFAIQIYEVLYQSEKELYVAQCKESVGGVYEWVDVYNPKTGELTSSR